MRKLLQGVWLCGLGLLGCQSAASPQAPVDGGSDAPLAADAPPIATPRLGDDAQPSQDARTEGSQPPGSAPGALVGDWTGDTEVGNCIDVTSWYSLQADGTVINRDIDDNACTHQRRVVAMSTGHYTLRDRVLEMTLDGIGLDRKRLWMSAIDTPVAQRLERFPIATAVIPPGAFRAGRTTLDRRAFTSADGAHFSSARFLRLASAAGAVLFEQDLLATVLIDPPLPLDDGKPCRVTVEFSLSRLDPQMGASAKRDQVTLEYAATVHARNGWRRIVPVVFEGLAGDAVVAAWEAMLASAGLDTRHAAGFAWTLRMQFFPNLGFDDADPRLLSGGLPESGDWLRSATPPPLP